MNMQEVFDSLPVTVEGESKIVKYWKDDLCLIKLKPTIYSFTANRAGIVEGSDMLRYEASKIFTRALREKKINHSYQDFQDGIIVSKYVKNAPPIEVIVKAFHSGTSKHRYYQMNKHPIREGLIHCGTRIEAEQPYPKPIVRFDWRNPLHDANGKTLADEVLCEEQADWFIDVNVAKKTALKTFMAISDILNESDIVLYDLCLFISQDGKEVFGEISQDCGRFRHYSLGSLDKDEWRAGGSSEHVLSKWKLLLDLLNKK